MSVPVRVLLICGIVCYVTAPLALRLEAVPIKGIIRGDIMIAMFIVGSLMVFAAVTIWHRHHLQHRQS